MKSSRPRRSEPLKIEFNSGSVLQPVSSKSRRPLVEWLGKLVRGNGSLDPLTSGGFRRKVKKKQMANSIVDFVRAFNAKEGRGCPVGAIEYVGGFSKKDIAAAKKSGEIVSEKGSNGGFFPKGEVTASKKKAAKKDSLKADMVAFITAIANDTEMDSDMRDVAHNLVARYNKECAAKKASAANRKSKE